MSTSDPVGPDQPFDSDLERGGRPGRPVHLRVSHLLLVGVGGAAGTASRYGLSHLVPQPDRLPVGIFAINVVGALVLGLLLAGLAAGGPDVGRRRLLRLTFGTGFLGGFTTYSSLAVDTVTLLGDGRAGWGTGYALATVLVGVAAAALGLAIGGRRGTAS